MVDYSGFDYAGTGTSSDSGSGGVLDSILGTVSSLGSTALLAFSPKNSAQAINPYGQMVPARAGTLSSSSSMMTWIALALVVFVGVFAFKKL